MSEPITITDKDRFIRGVRQLVSALSTPLILMGEKHHVAEARAWMEVVASTRGNGCLMVYRIAHDMAFTERNARTIEFQLLPVERQGEILGEIHGN